jgi:hypothetical protein
VRCVGRHVDGLPGFRHQLLASEAELHLALEHGEHLFEVVTVGRRAAAGWDMHVDKCVFAVSVVAAHKDGVGVADQAEVRKAFVFVRSSDGEAPMRIVGR